MTSTAQHLIPEVRPHPPSEAVKLDVFTEFRRGKTIENRELEPYTPAGSHLGQYAAGRHRVISRVKRGRSLLAQ